jgi:CheY-like chemotaxis protein
MPFRLLLVDDEKRTRSALTRALKYEQYAVWPAADHREALGLCDQHAFDLVILDYMMPDMDGLQLLVRIRKKLPLIRSIIISGKLDSDVGETHIGKTLEKVEVDRYLHKPVKVPRLIEVVGEILKQQTPSDWKTLAKDLTKDHKGGLQQAKETSATLKSFRKKPSE